MNLFTEANFDSVLKPLVVKYAYNEINIQPQELSTKKWRKMSRHLIMRLIFIFLLLQILVGNVRRFVGPSLRTLANAQNKFKRGKLSMISTPISNFALSCEKAFNEIENFWKSKGSIWEFVYAKDIWSEILEFTSLWYLVQMVDKIMPDEWPAIRRGSVTFPLWLFPTCRRVFPIDCHAQLAQV